jgi:hypothetical protein
MKTAIVMGAGSAGSTAACELRRRISDWQNGQNRYNNTDHSMMCGVEAVRALPGETDRTSARNINTESEYHETE